VYIQSQNSILYEVPKMKVWMSGHEEGKLDGCEGQAEWREPMTALKDRLKMTTDPFGSSGLYGIRLEWNDSLGLP